MIGPALPAETELHKLAEELAKPVSCGMLLLSEAQVSLWMRAIQCKQGGKLGDFDPDEFAKGLWWTLKLHLEKHQKQRTDTEIAIEQAVRPLFACNAPKSSIEEIAETVNGECLSPSEVGAILRAEMQRHNRSTRGRWKGLGNVKV
jgi:hypothetical protein